jgi:putative holliday junction resolvase
MRVLGVDFGFSRIGIAVAETEPRLSVPRDTIAASGALASDARAIDALARREEAVAIVLGLPVDPSGEEGRMAGICRRLAGHLEGLGWKVELVDETLTTWQADEAMRMHDVKAARRRKKVDGEAAAIILERYLDGQTTT